MDKGKDQSLTTKQVEDGDLPTTYIALQLPSEKSILTVVFQLSHFTDYDALNPNFLTYQLTFDMFHVCCMSALL